MESKISKAQIEVWEWKKSAYDQIKDLPMEDQMKFIIAQTRKTIKQIKESKREKLKKV